MEGPLRTAAGGVPLPVEMSLPAVWGTWLPGRGVTGVFGAEAAGVLPPVWTSPGRTALGAVGPDNAGDVPSGWT